jgi:hypothetical protein
MPRDQILSIFETIFLANMKPDAKRLQPVNQGSRGDCLMKNTKGQKSRDTVPLTFSVSPFTFTWQRYKSYLERESPTRFGVLLFFSLV